MTPKYPTRFQSKTIWRALTGIAILVIGILIVGLIWLAGKTLGYLQPVLVPLAVAGIIAYLLDPIVSWLQTRGLSRLKAVITVFASFVILLTALGFLIAPPIAKQVSDAFHDKEEIARKATTAMTEVKDAPWLKPLINYASEKVNPETGATHIETEAITTDVVVQTANGDAYAKPDYQYRWQFLISKYAAQIAQTVTGWFSEGSSKILGMLGLTIGFVMAPIYLYYFLKESSSIKAHWHEYVPLKASRFKNEVVDSLQEINGYLISFFRGQMLVAFIDGILVGIALWIFGLPYALVIGLAMAVLGVIPYIGNIICLIPACLIAFVHFGHIDNQNFLGSSPWAYVLAVVAIFLVVQQINSLLTAPKIVGDSVGLHPMTVIFSMLFWSLLLGGFIGALLAVPMTAAIKVLFRRYIWERKMQEEISPVIAEHPEAETTS
ncbi:AI-2E family transporter [Akkermansiaceae bacterium]|nr:AI-2E family transporter [Akkermansiaceae bacterium]